MSATYLQIQNAFPTVPVFEAALPTYPLVLAWVPTTSIGTIYSTRTRIGLAFPISSPGARTRSGFANPLTAVSNRIRSCYVNPLVAIGNRNRSSGTIGSLVGYSAVDARVRSGSVISNIGYNLTATGTRSRLGYTYTHIANVGTGVPSKVTPWKFVDGETGAVYVFEANGNAGGTPFRSRAITNVPTTAPDGVALNFQGEETVPTMNFQGTLRTKTQYDAFNTWYKKRRPFILVDDLGRGMVVYFEKWEPKRASTFHLPYRFTYTATFRVLSGGLS